MMEEQHDQQADLREIRNIMERSTRFLSLSGLSAIAAGIVALLGAAVAYLILRDASSAGMERLFLVFSLRLDETGWYLIADALMVLLLAIGLGLFFSRRKAHRLKLPFWNATARRTLYYFSVPMITGGAMIVMFLIRHDITLVASAMLLFYGLSLVSVSKFTYPELNYLGLSELGLGIFAGFFIQYGLLFWVIGFGILHIVYGIIIHYKYA